VKSPFLQIAFNGDIFFELLPILSTIHNLSQMQVMDEKYDNHAWCKLVTTNIKKMFGLSFRKVHCLGHLQCVQDDCENFVRSTSRNEMFWCNECAHIPILGQMIMIPSTTSLGCKFCHAPPFYVMDCNG